MNRKEFKNLKVGDNVIIKGNGGNGIHHYFEKNKIVTIIATSEADNTVFAHDKYMSQWISCKDIKSAEA